MAACAADQEKVQALMDSIEEIGLKEPVQRWHASVLHTDPSAKRPFNCAILHAEHSKACYLCVCVCVCNNQ